MTMKKPLSIKLIDERVDWIETTYLDDCDSNITLKQHSYVCPLCLKRKVYLTVNNNVVNGGSAHRFYNGHAVSYCGSPRCRKRADWMMSGWREKCVEGLRAACRWLADRLAYATCKLRGHKWYRTSIWGLPGNRAWELKNEIWCSLVSSYIDNKDGVYAIEDGLNELAQMAGEAWGHYEPNPPQTTTGVRNE